jgi:hypothetical protein
VISSLVASQGLERAPSELQMSAFLAYAGMNSPKDAAVRDGKRPSNDRSRSSQDAGGSKSKVSSPKFMTSFPSISPPETPRLKKNSKGDASNDSETPRAASSSTGSRKASGAPTGAKGNRLPGVSAMDRTVQAAANLRKSILETITSRASGQGSNSVSQLFSGPDDGIGDPLAGATDEHVLRIINSSGGPVAAVKKYSADLAEANERVATERNSKLKLVEESRGLRAELEEKDLEVEEVKRQLATAKTLFERYVAKRQPELSLVPQVQIVDSPAGPYALEDTSGTILATVNDDFEFPEPISRASTGSSSPAKEQLLNLIDRGKSIDTIRPSKKQGRASIVPQRLASAVKTETVEMKPNVEIESIPPALRSENTRSDALVDRLGFYITPDRERRHQEAALEKGDSSESSSINSTLQGDDESTLSASELLCDAPLGPATKLIFRSESSSRIFVEVDKRSKTPETVVTSPVTTTHAEADITTTPVTAVGALGSLLRPVQDSKALSSLLIKLNEAYDVQQKRRSNAWATFYEQTQELLMKGSDLPDEQGIAGVTALCSASNVSPEIRIAFNSLIRRGVPVSFRREVWLERSGANNSRDSELYESLLSQKTLDANILREINIDVDRTLANNVFFREGVGKERLRDVLVAFAQHNPKIGYSQGLNIIAANLLLMVPAPEDGFALLEVLVKDILPSEYYDQDGVVSSAVLERDGQILDRYLHEFMPNLHKHFLNLLVPLTMFTPGWFISAFASSINGEALYRLWDLIFGFCDGRFVFCFALALLRLNRKGLMDCRSSEELMTYLGGRMSTAAVSLDTLINETFKTGEKVTITDIHRKREALAKT